MMTTILIIGATLFLVILIWFVFFTNNDLEDDGRLSSIVDFEMPKLYGEKEGGFSLFGRRNKSKLDESENIKSIR